MEKSKLATPWCFLGPSGSGKISMARRWIEEMHGVTLAHPMEMRTFSVGDGYEARVLTSPYHFEIDIPNLSMQDKQIIGELLTMFLSSGDVLNALTSSSRKLVILRRAHCLSLPAAIRVRAILQEYVMPANASGMIWITAREMTGALSLLEDTFVRVRVPRMTLGEWNKRVPTAYATEEAWTMLEGRPDRAQQMAQLFPQPVGWPRRIQDFYDEMIRAILQGAAQPHSEPNMAVVEWIRGRVYDALSFCQTGPEIIDSCAAAIERCGGDISPTLFFSLMRTLAESEPHTSYRTPLALEWALLNVYEVARTTQTSEQRVSAPSSENGGSAVAVVPMVPATRHKKEGSIATGSGSKARSGTRGGPRTKSGA